MTREQALDLLAALPTHRPSEARPPEPALWAVWCACRSRAPEPSHVWTEFDVVNAATMMIARHIWQGED
jgi:hypothetical protein